MGKYVLVSPIINRITTPFNYILVGVVFGGVGEGIFIYPFQTWFIIQSGVISRVSLKHEQLY